MKVYPDMGKGTKFRRRNTHTAVRAGGFSLVELLVVVVIIAVLAAISVPLYLNQKKKAGDATIRSDVHNVAVHLATTYTSPVTAVAGSDGTATADLTVTTSNGVDVIPKMGTSVYANTTAWCISDIATSGKIFAATSTNRATYEATTFCVSPTTQPTPGSGGGGTVVSAAGNLLTVAQATPSGGYSAARGTMSYSGGMGTFTSNNATANTSYTYTNPGNTSVVVGNTYTMTVNITATSGASWYTYIQWYAADNASLGQSLGNTIPAGSSGVPTATGVAPAGVSYARVIVYSASAVTGNNVSFNQVGFWEGTGGQWAPPGQPIYQ